MNLEGSLLSVMGVGVACVTVGAGLTWGWPIALLIVGGILMAAPLMLLIAANGDR